VRVSSTLQQINEEISLNRVLRIVPATAFATLFAVSVQAQINNNPPGSGGPGGGRGPGVEASVVTNARSPEVNANNTITFRLQAPNAKAVQVFTDMPKLGDVPVNGSAGFEMTRDAGGVSSYTTPKLAPSYYQYWFVVDGFSTPDPQNTFVRPASGVYKSVVALPGKEADFMMFRDVPHGDLVEHLQFVDVLQEDAAVAAVLVHLVGRQFGFDPFHVGQQGRPEAGTAAPGSGEGSGMAQRLKSRRRDKAADGRRPEEELPRQRGAGGPALTGAVAALLPTSG
jgi:hypothetical protein